MPSPHANAPFSEAHTESTLEKMRQCLRDLKTVVDHDSAQWVREECKHNLTAAATGFRELCDEYRAVVEEAVKLDQQMAGCRLWERKYRLVQGTIEDVIRGLVDVEELRAIARDYASGDRQVGEVGAAR